MPNTLDTFSAITSLSVGDLFHAKRGTGLNSDHKITEADLRTAIVTLAAIQAAGGVAYVDTDLSSAAWMLDEDNMASDDATKVPSQQSVKAYVDTSVIGLLDDKGNYDAATNTPDLDVSPSGIKKGDVYFVSVAGTFFTEAVEIGDVLRALQDNPTALAHWAVTQANLINAIVDSDFSAAEGMMRKISAGTYEAIKTNLTATVAPTISNDSSQGYGVGSMWFDTVAELVYFCTDASVGAAVWIAGGGGITSLYKTGTYTAVDGDYIFANSAGGAFTINLPATPDTGDTVIIKDCGSAGTNNVTIGRNGETIQGVAADFVIDQDYGQVEAKYDGSDWKLALVGYPDLVESQINALINAFTRRKTAFIDIRDMIAPGTQAAGAETTINGAGSNIQFVARPFDGTAVECMLFNWKVPDNFDETWGVAFRPVWSPTTTDAGSCLFNLRGRSLADGDAINQTHIVGATPVNSLDASQLTIDDIQYGPESNNSASQFGLTKGELAQLRFQRTSTDGSDTYDAHDANVIGVFLVWYEDALSE